MFAIPYTCAKHLGHANDLYKHNLSSQRCEVRCMLLQAAIRCITFAGLRCFI